VAGWLVRAGLNNAQIKSVYRLGSIAHGPRDHPRGFDGYVERVIALCRSQEQEQKSHDPNIAKLNESYALVIVGDKTAILKTSADGDIKLLTHSAFETWHANRYVHYQDKNGDQKRYH
jgi:hypothetical protein